MASARAGCANAASIARISRRRAIRCLNIAVARLRRSAGGVQASHEAVRIEIDRHAYLGLPVEPAEPVADHVLNVERAERVDQRAGAGAPAPHGTRGGGGALEEHPPAPRSG